MGTNGKRGIIAMNYIPARGDLIMMDFDPSLGHEQKVRRPGLVISGEEFNTMGIAYVMAITSKIKGYEIEVPLKNTKRIEGVILTNQMKALDWTIRNIEYVESVKESIMYEVDIRLRTILEL
jgi:mRNA interferase MazF